MTAFIPCQILSPRAEKGEGGTMAVVDAISMIRAASPAQPSRFAKQIWAIGRRRETKSTSRPVPF